MTPAITIRPATIADARGLAEVQVDGYRTAYVDLLPAAYLAHFTYEEQMGDWQELIPTLEDVLLVAVDPAGTILGYALGSRLADGAADCELDAIHVRRPAQRQGVGRRLFAAIADHFAAAGARSLLLSTLAGNPIRPWYEALGGRLLAEGFTEVDDEGGRVPNVTYIWPNLRALQSALAGTRTDNKMTGQNEAFVIYHAAGGVVWDGDRILVLRRPSRDEVRLPKGHIDPGETAEVAALRETEEESGYAGLAVAADLGQLTVEFTYQGQRIRRHERYFLLRTTAATTAVAPEPQFTPDWLTWEAALAQLTFPAERTWVERARAAAAKE